MNSDERTMRRLENLARTCYLSVQSMDGGWRVSATLRVNAAREAASIQPDLHDAVEKVCNEVGLR